MAYQGQFQSKRVGGQEAPPAWSESPTTRDKERVAMALKVTRWRIVFIQCSTVTTRNECNLVGLGELLSTTRNEYDLVKCGVLLKAAVVWVQG